MDQENWELQRQPAGLQLHHLVTSHTVAKSQLLNFSTWIALSCWYFLAITIFNHIFSLPASFLQTSKSSVYMYSFEPEGTDALNDIKRLQSYGKYKLVAEYNHQDTHRVSALSCINSVQSVLCISATADRYIFA